MDLSKTLKWRDGNGNAHANVNANANADAKVSTIALPVLCTGELKRIEKEKQGEEGEECELHKSFDFEVIKTLY